MFRPSGVAVIVFACRISCRMYAASVVIRNGKHGFRVNPTPSGFIGLENPIMCTSSFSAINGFDAYTGPGVPKHGGDQLALWAYNLPDS